MKNIIVHKGFFVVGLFIFVFMPISAAHAQSYFQTAQGISYTMPLGDYSSWDGYQEAPYPGIPSDYYQYPVPCYGASNYWYDDCGPVYQGGAISITNVSGPNSLQAGQTGTWRVTTNAPSGSYVSVNVDWGEYVAMPLPIAGNAYQVSQNNTFTHAYQNSGTYTITFTASDNQGHSNSSSVTVQVGGGRVCPPYADNCNIRENFTATPTSGAAPLRVYFTSNIGGTVIFGDGSSGEMQQACYASFEPWLGGGPSGCSYYTSHTYTQAGIYTARTSSFNAASIVTITVTGGNPWCQWWWCDVNPYQPYEQPYYNYDQYQHYDNYNQYDYSDYFWNYNCSIGPC